MIEKEKDYKNGNAVWNLLWKINQALIPLIVAWGVWVTSNLFAINAWMNVGDRYTPDDARVLEAEVKNWVINNFPPTELKEDIRDIKDDINQIKIDLAKKR